LDSGRKCERPPNELFVLTEQNEQAEDFGVWLPRRRYGGGGVVDGGGGGGVEEQSIQTDSGRTRGECGCGRK
jgi:hypothetical protein